MSIATPVSGGRYIEFEVNGGKEVESRERVEQKGLLLLEGDRAYCRAKAIAIGNSCRLPRLSVLASVEAGTISLPASRRI